MATVVLTALGDDQAGLVDALSSTIAKHGGSWTESHMAQLAGKFAGIVVATVPDARADELIAALYPLEARGLLDITVEVADADRQELEVRFRLELLGQDRRGIIADMSGALAELDISIAELATETRDAPMAGGLLFEASALLATAGGIDASQIEAALAPLRDEFDIDISPVS